MNWYDISIHDPETAKLVHFCSAAVLGKSTFDAAERFAFAYGFKQEPGAWVISAAPTKTR